MDNQVELHDYNQGFDTHSFAGKMNTYEVNSPGSPINLKHVNHVILEISHFGGQCNQR